MGRIDWVEIPPGEYLCGLSEEQRDYLRNMVRAQVEFEHLPERTQELINAVCVRRWAHQYQIRSSEEKRAIETPAGRLILEVEYVLERTAPQRIVWVDTFYIARFPLTVRDSYVFWEKTLGREVDYKLTDPDALDCPQFLTWDVARKYCEWVGGRLPTAHEWEKAARGTDGRLYPWGNEWDRFRGNLTAGSLRGAFPKLHLNWRSPVNHFSSGVSPYGVWDMVGNLSEWTSTEPAPLPDEVVQLSLKEFGIDMRENEGKRVYVKGHYVHDAPTGLEWLAFLPARNHLEDKDLQLTHERRGHGVRPACDKPPRQGWQGAGFQSINSKGDTN